MLRGKLIESLFGPVLEDKGLKLLGGVEKTIGDFRTVWKYLDDQSPTLLTDEEWNTLQTFVKASYDDIWGVCGREGAEREQAEAEWIAKSCKRLGVETQEEKGQEVSGIMRELFALLHREFFDKLPDGTKAILSAFRDSVNGGFYRYIKDLQLPPEVTQNTFHYRYRLPLCGRTAEIERLEAFRTAEDREGILFWALTAPGGSGKSKLAYEYMKERREKESDWLFVWGTKEVLGQIGSYDNWYSPKKLFLAVDYANSSPEELKTWLHRLFQAREEKCPVSLRLLLIERHGRTKRPGFDSLQDPLWLESFCRDESIREHRYLGRSGELLELPGLDDTTAKEMMDRYAESQGKPSLDDGKKTELIDRVRAMLPADEERKNECRPLFLLFATDAVLHGEDPRHWDLDSMLAYALRRDREYWERNIDPEIRSSLIALARYATIVGSYKPTRNFPEPLKEDNQKIWEHFSHDPNACKQYFSVISERKLTEGTLYPLEPDLLGEYFVLSFLSEIDNPELLTEWRELLWREGHKPGLVVFFERCADDFAGNEAYIERLFSLLPEAEKVEEKQAVAVAGILFHFTIRQSEKGCKRAVDALEALSMRFSDFDYFAHAYASGLFNLTVKQDLAGREESVGKLREVYDRFPDNEDIAEVYARGLVNLTVKQDLAGREASVGKLREVYDRFPDNAGIAEAYAMGLGTLWISQPKEEREGTLLKIKELRDRFPENKRIALVYQLISLIG